MRLKRWVNGVDFLPLWPVTHTDAHVTHHLHPWLQQKCTDSIIYATVDFLHSAYCGIKTNKISSSWAVQQKWSNQAKKDRGRDEMHETTVERDDKELSRNERLNSDKRGTVGLEKRGGLWQRQTRGTDGMKITFHWNRASVMWHFWRITLKKMLKSKEHHDSKWTEVKSIRHASSFFLFMLFYKKLFQTLWRPLRAALMWTGSSKVRRL